MNSLIAAFLLAGGSLLPATNAPAGAVEGTLDSGIAVFRGIPYAQPPVGELRWRAPRALSRWSGTRTAKQFGHVCTQADPKGDAGVGSEAPSEDCLTLNIWSPARAPANRPVMVWLHGGGYVSGSGSAPLYDGASLARRGVVVVTLNYRLGRFGFFDHPQLRATGEGANFGLLDQRAALAWVRDNIAAFGGDPTQVTLFGNSAGAESVLFHMAAPESRGLFARAVVQSGLGGRALRTVAHSVDADRATVPLSELRALPSGAILGWPAPSIYRGFGPIIDGVTVRETIEETFRARRQVRVPLIIGYNGFEIPPAALGGSAAAAALVGHEPDERARGIAAYGSESEYEQKIASDALFRMPALRLAQLHAASGAPTWSYEFDVVPKGAPSILTGAPHASERAYVFDNLQRLGWPTGGQDIAIAKELADRWAAFARMGAPSAGPRPWKRALVTEVSPFRFTGPGRVAQPSVTPELRRYFGLL